MARKLGLVAGQNSIFFSYGTLFNGMKTKKPRKKFPILAIVVLSNFSQKSTSILLKKLVKNVQI